MRGIFDEYQLNLETKMTKEPSENYNRFTRLMHMGLAIAVVLQLFSSQFMRPAEDGHPGNGFFELHEFSGLAAFAFVMGFWLVKLFEKRGTPLGALFPWFSLDRLKALWADIKTHLAAFIKLRLPDYNPESPLASAIHGLGILLMSAMALSGTIYYFINQGNPDAGGMVGVVMTIHKGLAGLVWAYLIGHAGLAILHHYVHGEKLTKMWKA